jgi:hypothetical protein
MVARQEIFILDNKQSPAVSPYGSFNNKLFVTLQIVETLLKVKLHPNG